jgi:hypothetical protein
MADVFGRWSTSGLRNSGRVVHSRTRRAKSASSAGAAGRAADFVAGAGWGAGAAALARRQRASKVISKRRAPPLELATGTMCYNSL